jgi:imidazolonepropionase-like amidohydrolase
MNKPLLLTLALFSPWLQAVEITQAPYAPDSGSLAVLCGNLLDGRADEPLGSNTVVIRDGRFESITPGLAAPAGLATLDLSAHTCMPGLVEMHTHILEGPDELADLTVYYDDSLEQFLDAGRVFGPATVYSGITSARNLCSYYAWADTQFRDMIARGDVIGPRLQGAGYYLTIPGGGGDLLEVGGDASVIPTELRMGVSSSVDEFRRHAQALADGGADVIKVIASGAVLAYGGVPGEPEMSFEEIQAVVEVAHAAGLRVAAHAHGARSIKEAILAGADTIEHATYIDAEGIALAIEHDVALSMDVGAGDWMIEEGKKAGWVEEFQRKVLETTEIQRVNFQKAHAAGATIVFGTDAGIYPHGMAGMQFPYMVEWGMTPMEAIKSATSVPARYMGWQDRVGAIEPGLMGDLVAVPGDPLQDITLMERVSAVVMGGLVFKAPGSEANER